MSFFIVFDTCTDARYYGDVHQVLALPEGAVIRYEYKRRLFKSDAAQTLEGVALSPNQLPIPVLLMYGEKMGFTKGSGDPDTMLTRADSVFLPTRSAWLVGVGIDKDSTPENDVFYLHLKLRGFIDPRLAEIDELINDLEAANSLPFGDPNTQQTWISLLPASLSPHRDRFVSDDQGSWSGVVDKLVTLPTQFEHDVFWRVRSLWEEKNGARSHEITLVDRGTNLRVDAHRWQRDYPLMESSRYAVEIQTYSPHAHGANVPAGSTIAMSSRDDDQGLLKLAADPLEIVPNQVESKRFSISTDSALDTRFTGIHLETQVPDDTSRFPAGSLCTLTFSIRKQRWRLALGIVLVAAATGLLGYVAGAKPSGIWTAVDSVLALLFGGIGGWLMNQQFKIGSK